MDPGRGTSHQSAVCYALCNACSFAHRVRPNSVVDVIGGAAAIDVSCLLAASFGIYGICDFRVIGCFSISQGATGPALESKVHPMASEGGGGNQRTMPSDRWRLSTFRCICIHVSFLSWMIFPFLSRVCVSRCACNASQKYSLRHDIFRISELIDIIAWLIPSDILHSTVYPGP